MRLGVFGGSFDPVHRGHLRLADCCAAQAALDRVMFIPTAQQPLKPCGARASADERCEMVRLALAAEPRFELAKIEVDRGGPSYTVDTLAALSQAHPQAQLFLLVGADSLADMPRWREPERLCSLATPLVVARAGEPAPDFSVLRPFVSSARLAEIAAVRVEMPPLDISSSDIRRRIAAGEAWRELVPAAVADYIEARRLYSS